MQSQRHSHSLCANWSFLAEMLLKYLVSIGARVCKSAKRIFGRKIGFDTAENEPSKVCRKIPRPARYAEPDCEAAIAAYVGRVHAEARNETKLVHLDLATGRPLPVKGGHGVDWTDGIHDQAQQSS